MDPKSWPLTFGALAAVARGRAGPGHAAGGRRPEKPAPPRPCAGSPAGPPPRRGAGDGVPAWCEPSASIEEYFAFLPAGRSTASPDRSRLDYELEVLIALSRTHLDSGMATAATKPWRRSSAASRSPTSSTASGSPGMGTRPHPEVPRSREPFCSGAFVPAGLTLVLLVGETPKRGVHRAALLEALDLVERLRPLASEAGPIRILGPTFSGTTESLRISLRRWLDQSGRAKAAAPAPAAAIEGPPELARSTRQERVHIITRHSATVPGLEESFARNFGRDRPPGADRLRTIGLTQPCGGLPLLARRPEAGLRARGHAPRVRHRLRAVGEGPP